jgi:hypothetical protein
MAKSLARLDQDKPSSDASKLQSINSKIKGAFSAGTCPPLHNEKMQRSMDVTQCGMNASLGVQIGFKSFNYSTKWKLVSVTDVVRC